MNVAVRPKAVNDQINTETPNQEIKDVSINNSDLVSK